MPLTLSINGRACESSADPRTPLLETLRDGVGLRGTKYGCGEGECGACTVIVDGETICSCLAMTGSVVGSEVTTIEGLANDPIGVRLFKSFSERGGVQCGFCTPGFVLSAWSLLARSSEVTLDLIKDALGGNLCRCTGYTKIIDAIAGCAFSGVASPLLQRIGVGPDELDVPGSYWRPTSFDDLIENLESFGPQAAIIAGGTDLMVQHEHRLREMSLVDISAVRALSGIDDKGEFIWIGATTRWTEIRQSELLRKRAPLLSIAAAEISGTQIQNRGTIGGNIVNASPAADGLPALYVYDAEAVVTSRRATRTVPIGDFIEGPRRTNLQQGEILTGIRFPKLEENGRRISFFEKVGSRRAQTITKGSLAFEGWLQDGRLSRVRIALGAVGPTIIRARDAEQALEDDCGGDGLKKASALTSKAARPVDDIRSTANYRRALVGGLLLRGLLDADPFFARNLDRERRDPKHTLDGHCASG